jgi:transposase
MDNQPLFPLEASSDPNPVREGLGRVRFKTAVRNQVETVVRPLDDLIGPEHPARVVWELVTRQDLGALYEKIKAREHTAGRNPIDPQILMALWLKATLDGVSSAHEVARRSREDLGYLWLCGGVSVNYHTLSDFRVESGPVLDELITRDVATLIHEGLVELNRVAQDGVRVRASAGADTYRRRPTLEKAYEEARAQMEALNKERKENAQEVKARNQAAQERAVREREERLARALENMKKLEEQDERVPPSRQKGPDKRRVSTTDPDIPVMKMGDGGFRPAVNVQFATTTASQIITGVAVTPSGGDHGQMMPMIEQHQERYGQSPSEMLVDGGFLKTDELEQAAQPETGCTVYSPPYSTTPGKDPLAPQPKDTPAVAQWRARMATPEAQKIYRERAATAECVNAIARNRGLYQLRVRGLTKIYAVILWYVLAHNLMRGYHLRKKER